MQQQMISSLQQENKELRQMITQKNPLQQEVMSTYKRNKKRLIKNKIIDVIRQRQRPLPEVKEIVVDQMKYCSKASFYRYIEELRRHDFIHLTEDNTARIKPMMEAV